MAGVHTAFTCRSSNCVGGPRSYNYSFFLGRYHLQQVMDVLMCLWLQAFTVFVWYVVVMLPPYHFARMR